MTAKLPDWAIYAAATGALLLASVAGRESADAPEAPPPLESGEDVLIGPPARFEHTINVDPAVGPGAPEKATAFAVSSGGRWITAVRPVAKCDRAAILLGGGQGLEAKVVARQGQTAILSTEGAAEALPMKPAPSLTPGEPGFSVGFADGQPGELALRFIGRATLTVGGHGREHEPVLVWALVGRTKGLHGPLEGLNGAPVIDAMGRVAGVTLKEERQRGRLLTTTPETLAAAAKPGRDQHEAAPGQPVTMENYGRTADSLRRDLRVAEVRCL